jgi:hypothetical protein
MRHPTVSTIYLSAGGVMVAVSLGLSPLAGLGAAWFALGILWGVSDD